MRWRIRERAIAHSPESTQDAALPSPDYAEPHALSFGKRPACSCAIFSLLASGLAHRSVKINLEGLVTDSQTRSLIGAPAAFETAGVPCESGVYSSPGSFERVLSLPPSLSLAKRAGVCVRARLCLCEQSQMMAWKVVDTNSATQRSEKIIVTPRLPNSLPPVPAFFLSSPVAPRFDKENFNFVPLKTFCGTTGARQPATASQRSSVLQ